MLLFRPLWKPVAQKDLKQDPTLYKSIIEKKSQKMQMVLKRIVLEKKNKINACSDLEIHFNLWKETITHPWAEKKNKKKKKERKRNREAFVCHSCLSKELKEKKKSSFLGTI